MSELKEQIWNQFHGELVNRRRRRRAAEIGLACTLFAALAIGVQRMSQEAVPADPIMAQPVAQVVAPPELAVWVFDGKGMRFEVLGGDALASMELDFDLTPVVTDPEQMFSTSW